MTVAAILLALFGIAGSLAFASDCSSTGTPGVKSDKPDYSANETAILSGSGFDCGVTLTVVVTRPDGSIVVGDGSFDPGSDDVVTDNNGEFVYSYQLNGIEGLYLVQVVDASGTVLASMTFTDSHFRYGHLTWRTIGTRTAEFTVTNAWRRSGYSGSGGDGNPIVGDIITETVGDTSLSFGDGPSTGTLQYEVTAFDVGANWILGRAVIVSLPGTGVTVSESEPNDSIATADSMNVGDDYAGSLSSGGESDYVAFTLTSATNIEATTVLTGLGDSTLTLRDGAGTELAFNDDFAGLASRIQIALAAGTYYLQVRSFAGCCTGGYTLQLRSGAPVSGPIVHVYPSDGPFTAPDLLLLPHRRPGELQ